jgi:hypothetical protein
MRLIIILSGYIILSCVPNRVSETKTVILSDDICGVDISLIYSLLDSSFISLTDFDCFTLRDTLLDSEGVVWKGKTMSHLDDLIPLILFETSYLDTVNITRINIVSNQYIKDDLGIGYVRMPFKELKEKVDRNRLNEAPDGYLFLYNSIYPDISYQLDVAFDSKLSFGISSIDEIPNTVKLKSIIFNGL